jgi:5-oxoprolinase (ATP-hydrolysing)
VDESGAASFDFSGTAEQHPSSFNAPPAVVQASVLYVLRLLVGEDVPLNEGLLEPVTLVLPRGCLLNPAFDEDPGRCPAVVAGNTEVSQRVVQVLLKALKLSAGSQGTMNNVLLGNESFGYYETVCGGAGATERADGASGVHTHMTNTRITDPEILESRYPVRLEKFALRRGSGGRGRQCGGDGVVREYRFLQALSLSLVTQSRGRNTPFGVEGGRPGAAGRQRLLRRDGSVETLLPVAAAEVRVGDRLRLETPGGGGWGAPTA